VTVEQEISLQRHVSVVGFWAALITGVLNIAYFVPFLLYQPILHAPWKGINAYAANFNSGPFIAWVVPCLLLAPTFLVMITCLYYRNKGERQLFGLLAVVFAVGYAVVLAPAYYTQLTVVRHNLLAQDVQGLDLLLYAFPYPYSIPGAQEGIGYGFMCVSFIFVSRVFGKGKFERLLFWVFLGNGIFGSLVFTDLIYPLPSVVVISDLVIEGILLAIAPFMLAAYFRQKA
jgi:uncharacterized membrane protein YciS (DUF1049 family)